MNINKTVTYNTVSKAIYTWNMQSKQDIMIISEFRYRVNKYRESNTANKTVNCSMLLCNKGQYQDVLTK